MLALLHDVIVFENVSGSNGITATSGKIEFEALALQSLSVFSSRRQIIRSLTLGERTAAAEIEFEGVLAVSGLKTGANDAKAETLQLRGVTVFAFSDGKIVRISDYS